DMPRQLALEAVPHVDNVSLIRFALATERQFHQILGVTKFKMFLIDPPNDDIDAIYHPKGLTIPDPLTHAKYNGAIDLTNAGHGLYIVPILSLWGKPLGVLQVGRTVVPLAKGGPKVEMLEKQAANDALKLHLIALFAQSVRWRVVVHTWGEVHNVDEGTGEYVADPSLPPGWVAIAHGDHVYYENPHSGEQTWIKPPC
ncbi:hypothetical protein DYB28_010645, partial [Aphanomyces astaci]